MFVVVTDLEHAAEQIALNPALQTALTDERVGVDGNRVFARVQSYTTQRGKPMPVRKIAVKVAV